MRQTPAHDIPNMDLLGLMEPGFARVVDVGCMRGALARAYREKSPESNYVGIDITPEYAEAAKAHCTEAFAGDIETLGEEVFSSLFPSDCWVFGDCLEHLRDPWRLLERIRERIDPAGVLLACIPNAQHWSVQASLASGSLFYRDSGLLDRSHLRWFTRITMIRMLTDAGWRIENALARNLASPDEERHLKAVEAFAVAAGLDPRTAAEDAKPFQYIFRARPA